VVVGYFLDGRSSQELARFLGVTESRVSQLRSEALLMLKDGIEAQYDDDAPVEEAPVGRVARRKATYAQAISEASPWTDRMDHVQLIESDAVERLAAAV
jgi:RNA polymerase sigma factor for flagellar operon FliA